ncbi:MAG: glycosyltransferase family 2 protein [Clostridia bacterium]|nr:glycosyltransferase family 2 protein [Clostridia bacterium]
MIYKVLIVIPAFNEEKSIAKTCDSIVKYNEVNGTKYDMLVINDGSTDQTEEILSKNGIPHIRLLNNLGIGGAVQTGYKYAALHDYDIAVQFDGDGQHDIAFIDDLVSPIVNDKADMTIGSRFVSKGQSGFKSSFARRTGIKMISAFIKMKTGKRIFDTTSGFRAINKKLIRTFANNYPLEYPEPISTTEALLNGYRVEEVPVEMKEREEGKSSIRLYKNFYYMVNVILNIIIVRKGDLDE